jgi:hypothetical protein
MEIVFLKHLALASFELSRVGGGLDVQVLAVLLLIGTHLQMVKKDKNKSHKFDLLPPIHCELAWYKCKATFLRTVLKSHP